MSFYSQPTILKGVFFLILALSLGAGISKLSQNDLVTSVEVGIATLSPNGEAGGKVIPASCPSYEHFAGECYSQGYYQSSYLPPTCSSFTATPASITTGGSSMLAWVCNPDPSGSGLPATASISPTVGTIPNGSIASGSTSVNPNSTTPYSLTISNASGSNIYNTTVTVTSPQITLTANSVRVPPGTSVTITWSATNVASCLVTGPNNFSYSGLSGSQSSGAITAQSIYTIDCTPNGGGAHIKTRLTVNLIPTQAEQ